MSRRRIIVVGGGAAGIFAAIACAESAADTEVLVLEKGPQCLAKVRISGGGRCNVTHACFDPRDLSNYYPRGAAALIGPFHRFQPRDTVTWFAAHGVTLKTEADGRMFPVTDSSQTIIDCLLDAARDAGVSVHTNRGVEHAECRSAGGFALRLSDGNTTTADRLLLATGGCRALAAGRLASKLGHALEEPVPSLFTFHIDVPWVQQLAGIAVNPVEVSVPGMGLREKGPVLMTHWGLSGPAILRLSAWGARAMHARQYQFPVLVNWVPQLQPEALAAEFDIRRQTAGARCVAHTPIVSLPTRLWSALVQTAGVGLQTRWSSLSRTARHQLLGQLTATELPVSGRSLNKDEFVTCGGVTLKEINFKTLESRLVPGLHFAGELLDIDGLTGGFNFQAAWTTGWIAGHAAAAS